MSEQDVTNPSPIDTPLAGAGAPPASASPSKEWLPESYRDSDVLGGYDSMEAILKDFVGIKEMRKSADMGDLISVDPDDPESLKYVFNKLGRPETADNYTFEPPDEKFSEYIAAEDIAKFNQTAHDLNLTQSQYEGLMKHLGSVYEDARVSQEEYIANNVKTLEERWGKAGSDQFAEYQRAAIEGLNATGSDFLVKTGKEDAQWASHPATLELLRWVGDQVKEDTPLSNNTIRNIEVQERDTKDAIKTFREKHKDALGNPMHKDHVPRQAELMQMYEKHAKLKTFS